MNRKLSHATWQTAPKLGISTFVTVTGPETLAASDSLADELAESASDK